MLAAPLVVILPFEEYSTNYENERVLIADDMEIALESVSKGIELFGDGHRVVGKAASVEEVRALIEVVKTNSGSG